MSHRTLAMRNEKMKMNEIFFLLEPVVSETACSACNPIQSTDSQYSLRLSSLIVLYCLSRLRHNRE